MWDDLWEFHCNNKTDKEYFLGSMVVIEQSSTRTFEVVDGQQRLTTLALLFAAMSCFLQEHCKNKDLENFKTSAVVKFTSLLFNTKGASQSWAHSPEASCSPSRWRGLEALRVLRRWNGAPLRSIVSPRSGACLR
jgi:hypothetical protein